MRGGGQRSVKLNDWVGASQRMPAVCQPSLFQIYSLQSFLISQRFKVTGSRDIDGEKRGSFCFNSNSLGIKF